MRAPPSTPARVCYVSGSWPLVALCASLRAHAARVPGAANLPITLVFAGPGDSPAMRNTMQRLARAFGLDGHIVWLHDLVADLASIDDRGLAARFAAARERIGIDHPQELWVSYPQTGADRFLLELFPRAQVVLYEEGLLTYARPWSDPRLSLARVKETLRFVLRWLRRDPCARSRMLQAEVRLLGRRRRRPAAAYLILGEALGVPGAYRNCTFSVDPAILREVVALAGSGPAEQSRSGATPASRPRALVLGGNLSTWRLVPREAELAVYAGVVAALDRAGYEVWWKDHPRVPEPFLSELRARFPGVPIHAYVTDHTLPLEVVLPRDPVDLVVAGLSSSLLFAPLLLGDRVRSATFVEATRPMLQWPWEQVAALVGAAVPSLEAELARPPGAQDVAAD